MPDHIEESAALDLRSLLDGTIGLTPEAGGFLAQAASVCLEEEGHAAGVSLTIHGAYEANCGLVWDVTTTQMRRCWGDPEEATELGACAIAALLVRALTSLVIVHRARKGMGFDYWLGRADDDEALFQGRTRLEVTGIRRGTEAAISRREQEKLVRLGEFEARGHGRGVPAMIVVVEFGTPRSKIAVK